LGRGTGFTEYDVHCAEETGDPKTAPPVRVVLHFEENPADQWDPDMVAALDDLVVLTDNGSNLISLRVTCEWSEEKEAFDPAWEFLDASGEPLTQKAQRAMNLSGFFAYAPLFYLAALRDAADEFGPRSSLWARLLKSIRIPAEVEGEVKGSLDLLDAQLLAADPRLAEIAETIGLAAKVAIGQSEGEARLRMLPMNTWDLISRASVVLQNETLRPWLPLDHHGQGLQSLSVIFLFQAAVFQQLLEEQPGTEPIFLLEEPEAHLHPQAARTLWDRITALPGQKLVTTHSPYFVQNVPLRNLRLVRLTDGASVVSAMPKRVGSSLIWNDSVAQLSPHIGNVFAPDPETNRVCATSWFEARHAENLKGCFRDQDAAAVTLAVDNLRHASRGLVTAQEEHELSFIGRRIRGEIFFARRWILIEGQSEYVLLHAIGRALDYPLDRHGAAVIDFQNNGDADIYPALATSFGIPWTMITDGDGEGTKFREQLLKRGFTAADLQDRLTTLPPPRDLEDQLIADGHEALLRTILLEATSNRVNQLSAEDFLVALKKNKIPCISRLALRVETDPGLALQMPAPFVELVQALKAGSE
jgi:putative ATP-dependent endonuclease of OLD family